MTEKRRYHWRSLFAASRSTRLLLVQAALLLMLWETAGRILAFPPSILPTPSRIVLEIWRLSPMLRLNGQATFTEILLGLVFAVLLAPPAALPLALFPKARRFTAPLLLLIRRAPLLAITPVLFTWMAFGLFPRVLIVFLVSFFPALDGLVDGLRSVRMEMTELLRTMQAGKLQALYKLSVPASLPFFLDGLKTAVCMGISGAIVAEFVTADRGIGYLILSGVAKMDVPLVFAALTTLTAIGVVLYAAVSLLERILVPWHLAAAVRTGVFSQEGPD